MGKYVQGWYEIGESNKKTPIRWGGLKGAGSSRGEPQGPHQGERATTWRKVGAETREKEWGGEVPLVRGRQASLRRHHSTGQRAGRTRRTK